MIDNLYFIYWFPDNIEQIQNNNTITITPNPSMTQVTINSIEPVKLISISNPFGQVVYNQSYNDKIVVVDVKDYPLGVYFIKVNVNIVKRFIKQ